MHKNKSKKILSKALFANILIASLFGCSKYNPDKNIKKVPGIIMSGVKNEWVQVSEGNSTAFYKQKYYKTFQSRDIILLNNNSFVTCSYVVENNMVETHNNYGKTEVSLETYYPFDEPLNIGDTIYLKQDINTGKYVGVCDLRKCKTR